MKKSIKNSLIALCLCALAFVAISGILNVRSNVNADGSIFEMVNGASVKINDDGGIRFKVKMDETTKNRIVETEDSDFVKLYFLVTTQSIFDLVTENKYFEQLTENSTRAILIKVDESKIYQKDSFFYVNGCVTNVQPEHRTLDYVALAVIETTSGQTKNYEYATVDGKSVSDSEFSISNVRGNVYNILSQAVLDTEENYTATILQSEAYKGWFGKEEYPLVIKNLAQYEKFITKINDNNDFSGIDVYIKDSVDTENSTVSLDENKQLPATVKYIYTVTFLNEDGSPYKVVEVKEGEDVSVVAPSKSQTNEQVFTFDKWVTAKDGDTEQPLTNIQSSLTVYAKFSVETRKYNITWKNYNGELLAQEQFAWGLIPSYDTSSLADYTVNDDLNVYTFTGWDTNPVAVNGDATYQAVYSAKDHYVASTLAESEKGQYSYDIGNAVITRTEEASELPTGVSYGYKVTGTYDSIYTKMNHLINGNFKAGETYKFTVKFKPIDLGNISHFHFIFDDSYGTAHNLKVTDTVSKIIEMGSDTTQVKFTSWIRESQNEGAGLKASNAAISFVFNIEFEKVSLCKVEWKNSDGSLIYSEQVESGSTPVFDATKTPETYEQDGKLYGFTGWSPEVAAVSVDTAYTAQFAEIPKYQAATYTVVPSYGNFTSSTATFTETTDETKLPTGATNGFIYDVVNHDRAYIIVTINFNMKFEAGKTYLINIKMKQLKCTGWADYYDSWNKDGTKKTGDLSAWMDPSDRAATLLSADGYTYTFTPIETTYLMQYNFGIHNEGTGSGYKFTYGVSVEAKEVNYYTVTWKNGETTLKTDSAVLEDTIPIYEGDTPVCSDALPVGAIRWEFNGWSPKVDKITDNTTYTAQFKPVYSHEVTAVPETDSGKNLTNEIIEYTTNPDELPAGATYGFKVTGVLTDAYSSIVHYFNGDFKTDEVYRVVIRIKVLTPGEVDMYRLDMSGAYGIGQNLGYESGVTTIVKQYSYTIPADATQLKMTSYVAWWNHSGATNNQEVSFVVNMYLEKITDSYDIEMSDASWRNPKPEEIIYTEDVNEIPTGTTFAYIYKANYSTANTGFFHNVKGDFKAGTTYSFTVKIKKILNDYDTSIDLDPEGNYAATYNLMSNNADSEDGFTFTYTPTTDTDCIKMTSTVNIDGWNAQNQTYAIAFNITCNGEAVA